MKVNKRPYIPVILTFETEEEFTCFWDGIEEITQEMRNSNPSSYCTPIYMQLVAISNLFTEL